MMCGAGLGSRRRALATRARRLVGGLLVLAGLVGSVASAHAAAVTITWNAPTTNADGTPLRDLSSYRVYVGSTSPACPGSTFQTVDSPTDTPVAGQTVSARITGLTAGTTYFVRISAVDNAGNESACTASASGVAQADVTVSPTTTTSFGTIAVGGTVDRSFTVQNTSPGSVTGSASVGAPYSIVSGASFSLAAGASQTVTVRFRPTAAGTFAGNVTFAVNGDTISRGVTGSATSTSSATLTVTKNGTGSGTVTSSPAGITCGSDCSETVTAGTPLTLTATAASGSTFAGWGGGCSGTGSCSVTVSGTVAVTAAFNASPSGAPVPVLGSLSPASAVAGSPATTLTVNGSGFVASSVVQWNGAARTTTVISATQLSIALTSADLATARSVPVTVFTPAPGGGTSAAVSFVVTAQSSGSSSTVPGTPGSPSVTLASTDGSGATFTIAWAAASAATSYRYTAAFGDGSGLQQGTVTGTSFQLWMPYHSSGAATSGFICIRSLNGTLQSADQACNALTVPARSTSGSPAPVAGSLSPASAVAGSGSLTLTVNGSGFINGSVVRWNGGTRTTTFVSATQLRATISSSDLATAGSAAVTVFTPAPGGGTSGALTFTITAPGNPAPVASNLSPASAVAGSGSLTLTVNGSGFINGSVVRWNGSSRSTTYVSATQLRATISASDLASAGSAAVTVYTLSPGGGTSGALTFTITAPGNPAPVASNLSPASAVAGSGSLTLTVNGSGFINGSVVRWNGSSRSTTYVSATQLRATISASDLASAGSAAVTVYTLSPGGGTSGALTFTITAPGNPAPVASSLSPASAVAGSGSFTLTVNGSGFVSTSVVAWNSSPRTTTFVSATQLRATITAADLASAGSATVQVGTPAPGGGLSSPLTFMITSPVNPAPGASSLSPTSAPAGSGSFTLTVNGSSFVSSSVIRWKGSNRTTTFVSPTQLRATISASDLTTTGPASVTVYTPTPGGGTSAPLTFTVTAPANPVPVATSLSPTSASAGSATLTLTVNGSGFVNGSVVRWNGGSRTTTFVSASQLRATITTSDLASAGSAAVSVFTPTPGGGTSSSLTFTITASTGRPGAPGVPSVSALWYDGVSVTYRVAWSAGAGATSYRYYAALNDGSASRQGTTSSLSTIIQLPSSASGGWVCITSINAAGQTSATQSCGVVPAN